MKKKGFTLVEILITTFLGVTALGVILNSLISTAYLLDISQEEEIASYHLTNLAERILATPLDYVTDRFPPGVEDGPSDNPYADIVGGYSLNNEHITVTYPNPDAEPLELKITLSWQDRKGRTHTRSLSTFKSR
ncbi:MAG: hypothetical protein DRP61_03720 [Candidatus Omnitrophota bacterium]|nr:MAG: hypothetical protein DRP61_03720 [Candidatus Omnitrophota bacterium]